MPKSHGVIYGEGILTAGGVVCRVIGFAASFQFNAIPFAKVTVIPDPGMTISTYAELYSQLDSIGKDELATVSYEFTGTFVNEPSINLAADTPDITEKVFEGYMIGWGPVVGGSQVFIEVWLAHPLVMMDRSVIASDDTFGQAMSDPELLSVGAAKETLIPYTIAPYSVEDVNTDLWEKVIKPEFKRISKLKYYDEDNDAVLAALDFDLSKDELPLSLTVSNPAAVLSYLRRLLLTKYTSYTMWDTLIALGGELFFGVSPRVSGFSVVPTVGSLKVINPQVFGHQEFNAEFNVKAFTNRLFSGAALLEGLGSYSPPFDQIYRSIRDKTRSNFSIKGVPGPMSAPAWLNTTSLAAMNTKLSTGIGGELNAVGYKFAGKQGISLSDKYNSSEEDFKNVTDLLTGELLYKQKTAQLMSSIRFDIAPGSTIAVEYPGLEDESDYVVGFVHSVTTRLLPTGVADTIIVLSNVRSQAENNELPDALAKSPLYDSAMLSAPLIEIEAHTGSFTGV